MTIRAVSQLSLALLAGCNRSAPSTAPGNAAAPAAQGYVARVQALPPRQRDGVLFRAIQSGGGEACQGVKQVEAVPPAQNGHPTWRVTCTGGDQWSVTLADDGTAFVTGARP